MKKQLRLPVKQEASGLDGVVAAEPFYETELGRAYLSDSLELMRQIPDCSVNLVLTSPPYALHFKKEYGNASKTDYVAWMLPFAREIMRILKDDGSFVLNIGGSYNAKVPTRSLYHFKLLIALVEEIGFHLAQEPLLVQPRENACPSRMGDGAPHSGPRFGRVCMVARENRVAEGLQCQRAAAVQQGHDSPQPKGNP